MVANLNGIILEIDGALANTADARAESWRLAMSEFGMEIETGSVRTASGISAGSILPVSAGLAPYTLVGRAVDRRRREIFQNRFARRIQPYPGAMELLQRFRHNGLKIVLVTRDSTACATAVLNSIGASTHMDTLVSAEDRSAVPGEHQIARLALSKSGLRAAEVVMIGGTPHDALSAQRAGVDFIGLRCADWPHSAFANAVAVYNDPADMLRQWDALLPSPDTPPLAIAARLASL